MRIKSGKKNLMKTAIDKCCGVRVFTDGDWELTDVTPKQNGKKVAFEMSYEDARGTYGNYMHKLEQNIKRFS